jgi:hypothetical protein
VLIKADSGNAVDVSEEIIKKAYKFSTLNLDFKNVTAVISNGKTKRGRERKKYCTSKGELDLYSLILEAIAQDPPIEEIGFDDLLTRINKIIVGDDKVTPKSLKEYLGNIQEVLNDKNRTFEVLEWRDNVLYVIEALFLFYLRWGRNEQGTEY